jgi:hypothetical protein
MYIRQDLNKFDKINPKAWYDQRIHISMTDRFGLCFGKFTGPTRDGRNSKNLVFFGQTSDEKRETKFEFCIEIWLDLVQNLNFWTIFYQNLIFLKTWKKSPKFSRFRLVIILPVPTKMGKFWTKSNFLGKIQISIIGLDHCSLCRCRRGQVLDSWTTDGHCFGGPISSNFAAKQANKFFCVFCNNYGEICCLVQKQVQSVVLCKIVTNM